MSLRNFFRTASTKTLYWLITIPVVVIVVMWWVVTVAVILDLALPLKVIAVLVGFTALIALTALTLVNVFGRFKK